MNKFIKTLLLSLSVVAFAASCERKPLGGDLCESMALVPVDVDWSNLSEEPEDVTILVYNDATGELYDEFTYEQNDQAVQSYIPLPEGRFSAVVVNDLRNDLNNVKIEGKESLSTLRFVAKSATDDLYNPTNPAQRYLSPIGEVASIYVRDITITSDMFYTHYVNSGNDYIHRTRADIAQSDDYSHPDNVPCRLLLDIKPVRKDIHVKVDLKVEGVKSAILPVLADLENVSDAYMVATSKNATAPTSMQFYMGNRYEDDDDPSANMATLSTEFSFFGMLGDRTSVDDYSVDTPLQVVLRFKLADGSVEKREYTITQIDDSTITSDGTKGYIRMKFSLEAVEDEALPDVDVPGGDGSGGSGDSGVDTGVDPWQKEPDEELQYKK